MNRRRTWMAAAAAALAMTAGIAGEASAITSGTVSWTGRLESLTGGSDLASPTGLFDGDEAVSGSVTFDTSMASGVVDQAGAEGQRRQYLGAILSMSITIGGNTWTATGGNVRVEDGFRLSGDAPTDGVAFDAEIGVSGPTSNGLAATRIQLALLDDDTSLFSGLDVPSIAVLETLGTTQDYDGNINFLAFGGQAARYAIGSVSAVVPVPAGALLIASAFGIAGGLSWRRARKAG